MKRSKRKEIHFRSDKPEKEKSNKNKDASGPKRPPKARRPDRPIQQSDDEDEDGQKDSQPRQDVSIGSLPVDRRARFCLRS